MELLHMRGVYAEGGELLCIVCVVCAVYCGCACDLQALCTAGSLVVVEDGKCGVLVLLECAEFLPALGEDDKFAHTVFVGERGAADKVAVGDGKSAGISRLDEALDCTAQFGFGHLDGGLVPLRPECSGFFVVHDVCLLCRWLVVFCQCPQQPTAPCIDIAVGDIEVAGVPRVGDVAFLADVGEEAADFAVGIAARESVEVVHVLGVHTDDDVECAVVGGGHECRTPLAEWNAMCTQDFACAAMGVAADLVAVECLGLHKDVVGKPCFAHEVFHDEFRHGRAADVAVADE